MCLAVPGKVESIDSSTAVVNFTGIKRNVSVALVPNVKINDYVIVHAGFAIQILDKDIAKETLELLSSI